MNFFDRLYIGFEAEYLVMGRLYASGLEAFKLPGDFGYDLMVTDLKARAVDGVHRSRDVPLPYALQVKSRRFTEANVKEGPNKRPEVVLGFLIKRSNLEQLIGNQSSFLVLVCFSDLKDSDIFDSNFIFWLSSSHLVQLKDLSFFYNVPSEPAKLELRICYRGYPKTIRADLLNELVVSGDLTNGGKSKLAKCLPEKFRAPGNAMEYLSFVRKSKKKNTDYDVNRYASPALIDFAKMGFNVSAGSLD